MYTVSSIKPANGFHLRVCTGSQKHTLLLIHSAQIEGLGKKKTVLAVYLGLKALSSLYYSSKNNYIITIMSSFSFFFFFCN